VTKLRLIEIETDTPSVISGLLGSLAPREEAVPVSPVAAVEHRLEIPAPKAPKPRAAPKGKSGDEAKLTIRQRIINALKTGPKTSAQIVVELGKQGIESDTSRTGQHMYLLVRDGHAVHNEDAGTWSIAK
jgi:hypothetical protein